MKSRYSFLLLLFCGSYLFASSQDTLSLFDAIKIGIDNNFSIRIAANNFEIAKNNNNMGNAGMLPRADLNFNFSGSSYNRYTERSDGSSVTDDFYPTNSLTSGLQLSWTLFDGFAMFARREKLESLLEQGDLYLKMEIETAVQEIAQAYYLLAQNEKLLIWYQEQLQLSAKRMNIAFEKSRIGAGSELLAMQARVDYRADSALAMRQNLTVANLKANLNRLLGRSPQIPVEISSAFQAPKPVGYSQFLSRLQNENLNLRNAELSIRIAELEEKEAKALAMPQINLVGAYNFSRTGTPQGQTVQFNTMGPYAGIGASVTLFNGFNTRRRMRNAALIAQNQRLEFSDLMLRIENQAYRLTNELNMALELLNVEERSVELAKRNSEIAWERYRLGAISDLELREDQNRLLNARYRLIAAQANAQLAEIELLKLTGSLSGLIK